VSRGNLQQFSGRSAHVLPPRRKGGPPPETAWVSPAPAKEPRPSPAYAVTARRWPWPPRARPRGCIPVSELQGGFLMVQDLMEKYWEVSMGGTPDLEGF